MTLDFAPELIAHCVRPLVADAGGPYTQQMCCLHVSHMSQLSLSPFLISSTKGKRVFRDLTSDINDVGGHCRLWMGDRIKAGVLRVRIVLSAEC